MARLQIPSLYLAVFISHQLQTREVLRGREKFDWQEPCKFDCWLERTIFLFCCPLLGWCREREKIEWQEARVAPGQWK